MKMAGTVKTFISYSSQDSVYIHRLHKSLDAVGANPYVAEWWLEAGQPLAEKIRRNIEDSMCLLAILSNEANNSAWVHEEIGYAIAKGTPVIPVIEAGAKVRGFLEGLEYIPYDKYDFDETVYKILTSIRAIVYVPAFIAPQMRPPIRALDTLTLTCRNCNKKFTNALPNQDEINGAIEHSQTFLFNCPFCNYQTQTNPKTFISEP